MAKLREKHFFFCKQNILNISRFLEKNWFFNFFFNSDFPIFHFFFTFSNLLGFFFMDFWVFWIFFVIFLDIFLDFFNDFWDFWTFWKILDFFWTFLFLLKLQRLLLRYLLDTKNGLKVIKGLFLLEGQKKPSAAGRSPPQELEVGPRSGRIF